MIGATVSVGKGRTMIKLCPYVIQFTKLPEGSQRWLSEESGGPYQMTTQFNFYPVMSKLQNSINNYPWCWRRLLFLTLRLQPLVIFWMWRHHGIALWRPGSGAWNNGLFLTTVNNAGSRCRATYARDKAWVAIMPCEWSQAIPYNQEKVRGRIFSP